MIDKHEHLDEGTIHAWLDGALPPDESARIDAQASACTECAALVAEARGLIAASSRILSSLDTVPAGVIPGSSENVDQLAALRARHGTRKRNWWNDRRIVAAASIVFVAGVSTMVWRSAPQSAKTLSEPVADAMAPLPESTSRFAAPAPAPEAANLTREAPSRSTKAEVLAPKAPPAPIAVTTVDTGAERKVAATGNAPANEAKTAESTLQDRARQAESRRELARADQAAPVQQPLRQQAAATTQLQGFQQLRPDTMRVSAPPATFGQRALSAPAVAGAAADATPSCFRLQAASPLPDSVRLFHEILPLEADPSWFRADYVGRTGPAVDLRWRQVDSITIELRLRSADSSGVRFKVDSTFADVRNAPGMRAVIANRITCPVQH